jgi:hypothetical protein
MNIYVMEMYITVTRLLYEDGYTLSNGVLAVVASSGSQQLLQI